MEAKKEVGWGGAAWSILVGVLKFVVFLLFLLIGGSAMVFLILLSGTDGSWGVEWVLFTLSVLSVIVQEGLRKRWEAKEQFDVLKFRYTRNGNDDDDDKEGRSDSRRSSWWSRFKSPSLDRKSAAASNGDGRKTTTTRNPIAEFETTEEDTYL